MKKINSLHLELVTLALLLFFTSTLEISKYPHSGVEFSVYKITHLFKILKTRHYPMCMLVINIKHQEAKNILTRKHKTEEHFILHT
jgi:hypothetical protein